MRERHGTSLLRKERTPHGLELFMIGLPVKDMRKSLAFYRQLGLDIPEGSEELTHVEVKMGALTFFLDANPARWDPRFVQKNESEHPEVPDHYPFLLEFYLKNEARVKAKYGELTRSGYRGSRAPYPLPPIGMCFAMVNDPDGNTILLSGDLESKESVK